MDAVHGMAAEGAVRELVLRGFGVQLAGRSMGTYLARWGCTAQKPLRRAYEQDPAAVRRWLRRDYLAIAARAKAEGGTLFWGDETGLRADAVRGRSYAPRGRTPEVRVNHKRAGLGLISAVTNKGELRWRVRSRHRACSASSPAWSAMPTRRSSSSSTACRSTAPPRSAPGWPGARPRSRSSTCPDTARG
jgi:Winged helix-turn helix